MRVLALIPARGGSKRLPGKNTRPLLGVPLIGWAGRFAATCPVFDRTILSTDDVQIAEVGRAEGLDVPFLRPEALATDTASSVDVALHALDAAEVEDGPYDAMALLQPTRPFHRHASWNAALTALQSGARAAIGVAPTATPPHHSFVLQDGAITPLFSEGLSLRGQDLPQTVFVTGGLYLIRTEVLRATRGFFPQATAPVVCDHLLDAVDIDTGADFDEAERLAKRYGVTAPAPI
jgi:N-acylneuraminate cytidylyltransferase